MSKSNVGSSGLYEGNEQKNYKQSELGADRFHEGKEHSHKADDPKDERSIANKLARESKGHGRADVEAHAQRETEPEGEKDFETMQSKMDSTRPAVMHGNEPSKGAKIDQQLAEEEQEMLKKKGAA